MIKNGGGGLIAIGKGVLLLEVAGRAGWGSRIVVIMKFAR